MTEYWYRYEDTVYASPLDEYDLPLGPSQLKVELREFRVIKHTPQGVRLDTGRLDNGKFVLNSSRKQFACPTVELAKESFLARKQRQRGIYLARAQRAKEAIELILGKNSPLVARSS